MGKLNDFLAEVEEAFTPTRRKYLYRVATAVLLVLTVNGLVDAESGQAYALAVANLLGVAATEAAVRNLTD